MDHAPLIGAKVKVKPWHRYYPCAGIVEKVWKVPDYGPVDERWDEPDFDPQQVGWKHERDWRVTVRPDMLPQGWEYPDEQDTFLPAVFEIEPA